MRTVLTPEGALEIIRRTAGVLPPREVALEDAVGLVLAEDVISDVDLPPFRKSAMDGYAVRSEDLVAVPAELEVVEEVMAGQVPRRSVGPRQCAKVMTGAPVPQGADSVVMVEHTQPAAPGKVRVLRRVDKGRDICDKGEDIAKGQVALPRGTMIRPQEAAVLAATGKARVAVIPRPTVALLPTGNEVVEAGCTPGPGQVRDCNTHSLKARLGRLGIRPSYLGIARDEPDSLRRLLEEGLRSDVLIVSGGVSMGDLDLVPETLRALGVELLFERLAVKPGRPTVFGRRHRTLVFGLPGNPVSTLVIAELLLVPALRAMMGYPDPAPRIVEAVLEGPLSHKGNRRSYLPVRLRFEGGRWSARPVEYHGSADIVGFSRGNAVAAVPEGVRRLEAGERTQVVLLDETVFA